MEEWKKCRLGEICKIYGRIGFRGYTVEDLVEDADKGAISLSPTNLIGGVLDLSKPTYISWDKYYESPEIMIEEDDVVIVKTGSSVGRTAIIRNVLHPMTLNPQLVVLKDVVINKRYLGYLVKSRDFQGKLASIVVGSAIPTLSQKNLANLVIRVPSKETQERIACILSALDDKIELNNRINHNLEEQAQIVFDRIFNSDLTNNCLLSSIVDINPKRTLRKNEVARCIDMTYLNTAGSFPSGWEFKPYSGGMKFINGDTLMARITPCLENGKVAYINFLDKEETAFGSTEYIVFHAKEGYPNEMFYFLTRNKAFIEFATKNMNGSSGRQRVSGETIGNYIIPVLSEDDINELKTVSESTMKEILKNNLESRVLSEMRNTILPKLMSGELKINDLTC